MESRPASGHGEHGQQLMTNSKNEPNIHADLGRLSGLMDALLHEVREFKDRSIWRLDDLESRVEIIESRCDPTTELTDLKAKVEAVTKYQDQRKVPNKWMDRIFTSVVAGTIMLVLSNLDWLMKVFS